METVTELRGHLFLSDMEKLLKIIEVHKLKAPEEDVSLYEVIDMVDRWLIDQHKTEEFESIVSSVKQILCPAQPVKEETIPVNMSKNIDLTSDKISREIYRKEFKISGTIDSKSGISFTNLTRQIDLGKRKLFTDIEIIDGVIRAIPINSGLRSYLEGLPDVSLSTLRGILRAHYKERTATELYTELGSIVQGSKEDPSDFLLRAMDLRNRINTSSLEKDELRYDRRLVNQLFVRAVETGIVDQSIRHEFSPYILSADLQDEVLIQKLNEIVIRDVERKGKVGKKRTEMVAAVEIKEDKVKESKVKEKENAVLVNEIKSLQEQFTELKELVKQQSQYQPISQPMAQPRQQKRSCFQCYKNGNHECRHCWRCGSASHFRFNCRANLSGNEQGSHPRDRM